MATGTIHYDILTGLKSLVEELALADGNGTALPDDQVYLRELPTERNLTLPCVVVSKAPLPEQKEIGDNYDNIVGYPCIVTVLAAKDQDLTLVEWPLTWRQEIEAALDFEQPPAVEEALPDGVSLKRTEWEPMDVIDLDLFRENLLASAALVWVFVWKARG